MKTKSNIVDKRNDACTLPELEGFNLNKGLDLKKPIKKDTLFTTLLKYYEIIKQNEKQIRTI